MKKTTYILIGMVLAGFAAIVAFSGLYIMGSEEDAQHQWVATGEFQAMELPTCKVLKWEHAGFGTTVGSYDSDSASKLVIYDSFVEVSPTTSSQPVLSVPASLQPLLSVSLRGDTCTVCLSATDELRKQFAAAPSSSLFYLKMGTLRLQLPAAVQQLQSSWKNVQVNFRELEKDSFALHTDGHSVVEACRFKRLNVTSGSIELKSGRIEQLYLDLDCVYLWKVQADSCEIDTEILTAVNPQNCVMQRGECKKLYWLPKSDKSTLDISVTEPVVIEVQQE